MKRLVNAFTDPAVRPRTLVWTAVALVGLMVLATVGVVGTSSNWFCTQPCHIVHYDNTLAFEAGSHVNVSCVACHEPVNGGPLTFIRMKIEVLPDLFATVFRTFHLPMNEGSAIALEMTDEYCTQCHNLDTRVVTSSEGIVIDHAAHSGQGVTCPTCHNRVAHPEEDVEYVLEGDKKHENWMSMDACFRCHSQEAGAKAPGRCTACHPAGFDLLPASHETSAWAPAQGRRSEHGIAATEEASRVAQATAWAEGLEKVEAVSPLEVLYEQTINTCYTCHERQYCVDCHGVEMPHPAGFVDTHAEVGRKNAASCAKCHGASAAEATNLAFCNSCHHSGATPGVPWIDQHDDRVRDQGADGCFECHRPTYCSACHVGGRAGLERYLREQSGQ